MVMMDRWRERKLGSGMLTDMKSGIGKGWRTKRRGEEQTEHGGGDAEKRRENVGLDGAHTVMLHQEHQESCR